MLSTSERASVENSIPGASSETNYFAEHAPERVYCILYFFSKVLKTLKTQDNLWRLLAVSCGTDCATEGLRWLKTMSPCHGFYLFGEVIKLSTLKTAT